jgi:magnesium-transporting ATPase (P-type)
VATDARTGLSEQEAQRRLRERGTHAPPASSRSYRSIVRANVFTVFNIVLLVFGVITLAFGALADALFLVILVRRATARRRSGRWGTSRTLAHARPLPPE